MKKLFLLTFACILAMSSKAYADDVSGPLVDSAAISPLKKGQSAPFAGVLLTPKAVATIITELGTIKEKIAIEVESASKTIEAKKNFELSESKTNCNSDKKIIQAVVDEKLSRIKILEDEFKKSEDALKQSQDATPSRALWMSVGFVGGVVVTVITVFAVSQAVK